MVINTWVALNNRNIKILELYSLTTQRANIQVISIKATSMEMGC